VKTELGDIIQNKDISRAREGWYQGYKRRGVSRLERLCLQDMQINLFSGDEKKAQG